ncbi:energy transducer TonB family protein [Rhodoplanes roseus]|uniref:TonB C-terminal domain-containing protein n=1 Tax=Rhodoplanes roseus TaxID=29409 RepID=A0A327L0P8_9BRAD|nr:TonB family protein [Rhodoplanes roseus]RAI44529.1 hypothetical protein CH341_08785 [Rhodoplanes roseus]
MTARETWTARHAPLLRWTGCAALVVSVHLAGAAALLPDSEDLDQDGGVPVVTIELAAVSAAPETAASDLAPGPTTEPEHEAPPVETPPPPEPTEDAIKDPEPPPPVEPRVTLPAAVDTPPPPPPDEAPVEPPPVATAPPSAAAPAPRPATAAPGAVPQVPPATMARWQTRLLAQLHRHKRYPAAARGRTGIARVAFTIDRDGRVLHRSIATSSGSEALDAEALALLDRASPLPVPPTELSGTALSFVVPIRFTTSGTGASSGGR